MKSDPDTYRWDDLVKDGSTRWDGVRNAQARNNLAAMASGDRALFYHCGESKAVVGIAKVVRAAYPDPTADDERWLAVDLAPVARCARRSRSRRSRRAALAKLPLVRQGRLSVMPIEPRAFARILALGKTKLLGS